MVRNYFKTAIRNLLRNKSYTFINAIGLAIGITSCLLIFLVVKHETSYDTFHPEKEHIYRICTEFHTQDGVSHSSGIAFPAGPAMRLDFPEIKKVADIFHPGNGQISFTDEKNGTIKNFNENNIYFSESAFFDIFSFKWLSGNAKNSLGSPNQVVLTRDMAIKYFGSWEQAIGKIITYDNKYTYKVSGILENIPSNSDFPLGVVISYPSIWEAGFRRNQEDWVSTYSDHNLFVVLPPQILVTDFQKRLKKFAASHKPEEYSGDGFVAQPLMDIHYNSEFGNFSSRTFSRELIKTLSMIGLFLLLIACFNFVNLATALAVNRSREVGVRKVMGSNRSQLIFQFLGETTCITLLSLSIALILTMLALPLLSQIIDVKLSLQFTPSLILFIVIMTILVIVVSGVYPAFVLSGFHPITALKNKITGETGKGITLRRALVTIQFTIAQILIIATLVVVGQTDFFRTASMGFDKSAIINVPIPDDSASRSRINFLRDRFLSGPAIEKVSFSYASPSDNGNWQSDFKYDHAVKSTNFSANLKWADVEYFNTYHLEFLAGRPYQISDTVREFVVNETLLKKLGIAKPAEAIGKEIDFWDGEIKGPIVGVVKDFNTYNLRQPMAPVVLATWKDVYQIANIRIKPGKEKEALAFIEKTWTANFPSYAYQYAFLDKKIEDFYKQENQLSKLYKAFAAIAILLSCLGLYGLASYMIARRMREVGIRKVLGASIGNILYLFSREFTLLILIAFAIAAPLAYYFMNQWLEHFTYRIHPGSGIFLLAVAGSIIIAWATVGYRSMKAALANPVKTLRTE